MKFGFFERFFRNIPQSCQNRTRAVSCGIKNGELLGKNCFLGISGVLKENLDSSTVFLRYPAVLRNQDGRNALQN